MSRRQEISFTVEYLTPPSVNHYKKPCKYRDRKTGQLRSGMKLTAEAKAYTAAVCIFSRGDSLFTTGDRLDKVIYGVHATIYLGKGKRLDADNGGKLICDSLETAGVIHSDAFVRTFTAEVIKTERHNPRTEIRVWRIQ